MNIQNYQLFRALTGSVPWPIHIFFFHLFQVAGLKNFQLELEKDVKVRDVKKMAQEECNIEPEHMRLIYNSRQLKDWDTLESYKGYREAACAIWDG